MRSAYPDRSVLAGSRLWSASFTLESGVRAYLARHGRPISYGYVQRGWPLEAYQTAFARTATSGSAGTQTRSAGGRVVAVGTTVARALETVAGAAPVQRAYDAAVAEGHLWHEFGDSALLLP